MSTTNGEHRYTSPGSTSLSSMIIIMRYSHFVVDTYVRVNSYYVLHGCENFQMGSDQIIMPSKIYILIYKTQFNALLSYTNISITHIY